MLGKLMPTGGGPPIPLLKPKLLIGRQNTCDIPLSYPAVSSRHCELELRNACWWVRDLGSVNGTRINGVKCNEGELKPEAILGVARHYYRVVYTPTAAQAASPDMISEDIGTRKAEAPRPPRHGFSLGHLVPCGGGKPILLNKETLIVGRQPGCDIVIADPSVSGRHCRLNRNAGFWFVHDLGSRNGIRVDGVRCQSEILSPGAVLCIAALRYRIHYQGPDETPASTQGEILSKGLLDRAGLKDWKPADEDE
jgi:pSer/pThr/pTyr-binding forkhead associated (FHA) protein